VTTFVSLDPIMLDGTGMCGACRVSVAGETKFACVDGPFFDAHAVDFDEAVVRSKMYVDQERLAVELAAAGR
jgi:ferredoxin--NADP+ reductase